MDKCKLDKQGKIISSKISMKTLLAYPLVGKLK